MTCARDTGPVAGRPDDIHENRHHAGNRPSGAGNLWVCAAGERGDRSPNLIDQHRDLQWPGCAPGPIYRAIRATVVHPSTIMFATMTKIMIPVIAPARKHNVPSIFFLGGTVGFVPKETAPAQDTCWSRTKGRHNHNAATLARSLFTPRSTFWINPFGVVTPYP